MTNTYTAEILPHNELLGLEKINLKNTRINDLISKYLFITVSSDFTFENNQTTYQQMKDSKIVIINEYKGNDNDYFIIGFKRTIINIKQNSINFLHSLFSHNENLKICFLSDFKKSFDDNIKNNNNNKIQYTEINYDSKFEDEITNFKEQIMFPLQNNLLKFKLKKIISCIAGYLIKNSYMKITEDRLHYFIINEEKRSKENTFSNDEFIFLSRIGSSFSSVIRLAYYIEKEELVAVKTLQSGITYSMDREIENYRNMDHPFIPRYYGTIEEGESNKSLVIEFINGHPLSDISKMKMKMKDEEKLIIIFDLLCIFSYLKLKKYIYRDLKPNNVILDNNNQIVLIDFDSMISNERLNEKDESEFTRDFSSDGTAPEINESSDGIPSYQSDVYSLGKLILFILTEKPANTNDPVKLDDSTQNNELNIIFMNDNSIFKRCLKEKPDERPTIEELIKELLNTLPKYPQLAHLLISKIISNKEFYLSFIRDQNYAEELCNIGKSYLNNQNEADYKIAIRYFSFAADLNIQEAQFYLGEIYYTGKYCMERDINKAIQYYLSAANQNDPDAQFNLGVIYYTGEYITQDINQAIQYFILAANQNHPQAQSILGDIYSSNVYVPRNIDKAIHYFQLAANQNDRQALFNLGSIYFSGEYIQRDMNKAIHYFWLAANQDHIQAIYNLGGIIFGGEYIKRDIELVIFFISFAANHNHLQAQFNLGEIYSSGVYTAQDINKAIFYYSLAANQNHVEAQFCLGEIYYRDKYKKFDITKAIHYYSLAASHDHLQAQFILGEIYSSGEYIKRDIIKAIHYFQLAAKQNHQQAQYNLGLIYYLGEGITPDITKAIYYFSLAADQNDPDALYNLGEIYYLGEYVKRDINKAIHFFTLATNQNDPNAQYNLGIIYITGDNVTPDINKGIHFLLLAADQSHPQAQFILGSIYYNGDIVPRDINKAIHYLTLAADNNHRQAQFELGIEYFLKFDMKMSIHYLIRSALNGNKEACFAVGYLYHEGKYMERDIDQCIRFYKEASSFNNQFAKNNLGIIYKKGFEDKIKPRLGLSIEYFKEAIKQKNNAISMYNLGHLYLYENPIKDSINQSIDLLIRSLNEGFPPSFELLCISLFKKYDNDIDSIKQKLDEQTNNFDKYKTKIYEIIEIFISNKSLYESEYLEYKNIDFVYNVLHKCLQSNDITKEKEVSEHNNTKIKDISSEFYEGFGIQIDE
ncbi:hypothetical protein M9Y10_019120 [Tritrichomonas musculus]|uniref:Protein kinase domain-containing protein n=1 Tax=Tritrichomonas musculus TaxID=1915356 RepID=A0ABR2GKC1_9EUKA